MTFKQWIEDCGEVREPYQNKFPYHNMRSKYVTDDNPIPKNKRGKEGVSPTLPPESIFGYMKKKMKRT